MRLDLGASLTPQFKLATSPSASINIFHPGTYYGDVLKQCFMKKLMSVIFYVPFLE